MSGAFGMHGVYWAHRESQRVNSDGQCRHVYDLRGTHRPSCGWDGGMAVVNEADGYAVFQAWTWIDKNRRRNRTISVKIHHGDEVADVLRAIEDAIMQGDGETSLSRSLDEVNA